MFIAFFKSKGTGERNCRNSDVITLRIYAAVHISVNTIIVLNGNRKLNLSVMM